MKRQFTITHVGERWVDSGGESRVELSALKMKRFESTQDKEKYLSTTVVRIPNAKLLLRSSFLHFVHQESGDTDTFAFNILLS